VKQCLAHAAIDTCERLMKLEACPPHTCALNTQICIEGLFHWGIAVGDGR